MAMPYIPPETRKNVKLIKIQVGFCESCSKLLPSIVFDIVDSGYGGKGTVITVCIKCLNKVIKKKK